MIEHRAELESLSGALSRFHLDRDFTISATHSARVHEGRFAFGAKETRPGETRLTRVEDVEEISMSADFAWNSYLETLYVEYVASNDGISGVHVNQSKHDTPQCINTI